MKAREVEVLAEAVRTENLRREALNAQARFASRFSDLRRLTTVQSLPLTEAKDSPTINQPVQKWRGTRKDWTGCVSQRGYVGMACHHPLDPIPFQTQVSEVSFTTRTPQECRIRWLGDCHPQINHSQWSAEETSKLKTIISELSTARIDWVDVSKKLGVSIIHFPSTSLQLTPLSSDESFPNRLHATWSSEIEPHLDTRIRQSTHTVCQDLRPG